MERLKFVKAISGHPESEIYGIIKNPYNESQLITVGHDCLMNVWNIETLQRQKIKSISTAYQTFLYGNQSGIFVGIGTGAILQYNKNFQEVLNVKIHTDCVTGFVEFQKYYISSSLDGTLKKLSKDKLEIEKSLQLDHQIYGIYKTGKQNQICIAGSPSYMLQINTFTLTKLDHNYSSFVCYDNKIFGISDETGLKAIHEQIDQYIPCEYALCLDEKLLVFSEGSAGILKLNEQGFQQRFMNIPQLKQGYSIRASVTDKNKIYLASDDGNITILQLVLLQ